MSTARDGSARGPLPSSEDIVTVGAWAESIANRAVFAQQACCARNRSERYEAFLGFYRALWPVMKDTPCDRWAMDPNEIDWHSYVFSPIESMLWSDIRQEGVVLYPQHPVAGYFVDFGHPVARVAIECDGKEWHLDKTKDKERQAAIEAKGWRVYRLTGRQCYEDSGEVEDPDTGAWSYILSDSQLLIREIGERHGISPRRVA